MNGSWNGAYVHDGQHNKSLLLRNREWQPLIPQHLNFLLNTLLWPAVCYAQFSLHRSSRAAFASSFVYLSGVITDDVVDYWLGGTSALDTTGAFRWESTGSLVPIGPPFWFPGQPDFSGIERALSLSKTGLFADEDENIGQKFICQIL